MSWTTNYFSKNLYMQHGTSFSEFFFVQRSFKVMPIYRIRNKKLSFPTCREKLENGHSAIFNLTISISTPVPMNLTHHNYI